MNDGVNDGVHDRVNGDPSSGAGLERFKRDAAVAALERVASGMRVGLGTGSTARHVVLELGRRLRTGELRDIVAVPTSLASEALARESGVPLGELGPEGLDVAIDGADEVAPGLDLIKGLGGALVREKIVAVHAREFVVVADATKRVKRLGSRAPVPVELVPFGARATMADLERLAAEFGGTVAWRVRDGRPVLSDNGQPLADARLGPITDPAALEARLRALPGVAGTGLFLGVASLAYVAGPDGVERLER